MRRVNILPRPISLNVVSEGHISWQEGSEVDWSRRRKTAFIEDCAVNALIIPRSTF